MAPIFANGDVYLDGVPRRAELEQFFLALLGLLIVPMLFYWRARAFERARWAESDYG